MKAGGDCSCCQPLLDYKGCALYPMAGQTVSVERVAVYVLASAECCWGEGHRQDNTHTRTRGCCRRAGCIEGAAAVGQSHRRTRRNTSRRYECRTGVINEVQRIGTAEVDHLARCSTDDPIADQQ